MANYTENEVQIVGYIGHLGAIGYTSISSTPYKEFSVATTNRRKKQSWHTVVVYGELAKNIEGYFDVGDQVAIKGEIDYQSWEQGGEQKNATKINAWSARMVQKINQSPVQGRAENTAGFMDSNYKELSGGQATTEESARRKMPAPVPLA